MIPTNKSKPKHLRIEGKAAHEKPTKIARKRHEKSNELQIGNRRNHESFQSLGVQILYKRRKNLTLWSKEMRSGPEGWFAWKP
jgi:hypothetical protein